MKATRFGKNGSICDGTSGDSTQLIYLRARYYNPADGRFQSRDTWEGDINHPLSLNRWGYVEGNPVNRNDPSGYCSYDVKKNIDYVEKNFALSKWYWLDTYVAAGIATQCWATVLDLGAKEGSGKGPAQTSDEELRTPWGEKTEGNEYVYGKLCYILIGTGQVHREDLSCSICKTYDEMVAEYGEGNFKEETPVDQTTNSGAVMSMRRRIWQVLNKCTNCTDTDRFIAAALAQDVQINMNQMEYTSGKKKNSSRFPQETDGLNIDWKKYWEKHGKNWNESYEQINRFDDAVTALYSRGWGTPNLDRAGIDSLKH